VISRIVVHARSLGNGTRLGTFLEALATAGGCVPSLAELFGGVDGGAAAEGTVEFRREAEWPVQVRLAGRDVPAVVFDELVGTLLALSETGEWEFAVECEDPDQEWLTDEAPTHMVRATVRVEEGRVWSAVVAERDELILLGERGQLALKAAAEALSALG